MINGGPISNNAGVTFVDGSIIRVVYDVTQCAGSQYFVFDTGGNQIAFPNFILLGHELAHAFHLSNGTDAGEVAAETDENSYRTQYGVLPLRDVNSHAGGCGFTGGGGGGGTTISCIIASAAYGSGQVPELQQVRRLRDVVLRRSAWGAELFDGLHEEYYRFSPQVAARMKEAPDVRLAISRMVVEPFFEFLTILEMYARAGTQVKEPIESRLQSFDPAPHGARQMAAALTELKSRLGPGSTASPRFGAESGMTAAQILSSLFEVIEATVPAGGYVSWALLDPLILFWNALASESPCADLLRGIDGWLGATPLPRCYAILDAEAIAKDLRYLGEIWFTSPAVRLLVGRRLSEIDRISDDSYPIEQSGFASPRHS